VFVLACFVLVIRVRARVPLPLLISHLSFELWHLTFIVVSVYFVLVPVNRVRYQLFVICHLAFDISPFPSNPLTLAFRLSLTATLQHCSTAEPICRSTAAPL
jgi:hypothetical protein